MNKFLLLLFSCFLTSCVVYDETQPFRPPYREHVIIYDVWHKHLHFTILLPQHIFIKSPMCMGLVIIITNHVSLGNLKRML